MKKLYISTFITLAFISISSKLFAQNVNIPDFSFNLLLVSDPSINTNGDGSIQVSEAAAYSGSIDASSQGIFDLTGIEAFTSLTGLDVGNNNLTTLDVHLCTALTFLDCTNNNLTSLNIDNLPYLTTIYCNNNSLTCLDISTDTAVTTLTCGGNFLTSLNLKNGNNTSLTTMNSLGAGGMLYCIQVDNVAYAMSAGWPHDTWSNYNAVCGLQATASYTANDPQCFGTPVTFTNTSTNSTRWCWDFGDGGTSTQQNPAYTYPAAGYYTTYLIAINCNSRDTASAGVAQGMSMYGTASYSLGPVTSGFAVLYLQQPIFISFDTVQVVPLDAFGNFIFNHVPQGNYLVQIFPDTLAYPTLVPTYYGTHWLWDSAGVHVHGCFGDTYPNVTMVELTPSTPGIGYIQGFVIQETGFGRAQGDPVHGVVVKRGITGSSQIIETTVTDTNGEYIFNNVGFGNYTIYVDIPGLHRDSVYDLIVDATTNQFPNLYYVADSSRVYIVPGIGIDDISTDPHQLNVFPNPVKENVTVGFTLNADAKVQLDIYNVLGVKVQSLVDEHLQSGEHSFHFNPKNKDLKPGIYFISLTANRKTTTRRVIVME